MNKLKGWEVALKPIVELDNLAHARGVTPTKSPGLETIVDSLWPGVEVEGKHGPGSARFSDLGPGPLTSKKKSYCHCDGYEPAVAYNRLHKSWIRRNRGGC